MNGAFFLATVALICAVLFLNGLRFARATRNPWAGRTLFGMPVQGSAMSVAQVRRMGLAFMFAAPLFLLFVTALVFGLLGPVAGLTPIKL